MLLSTAKHQSLCLNPCLLKILLQSIVIDGKMMVRKAAAYILQVAMTKMKSQQTTPCQTHVVIPGNPFHLSVIHLGGRSSAHHIDLTLIQYPTIVIQLPISLLNKCPAPLHGLCHSEKCGFRTLSLILILCHQHADFQTWAKPRLVGSNLLHLQHPISLRLYCLHP